MHNHYTIKTTVPTKLKDYLMQHQIKVNMPQFRCLKGICSICLIEIVEIDGEINRPTDNEKKTLSALKKSSDKYRLCCQTIINGTISYRGVFQ